MQSLIITSVILLVFAVHGGSAIKCYVCNSHTDSNCAMDAPPENLLKDCRDFPARDKKLPYTYCRKITQIIEFSVNSLPPDNRVIRTCGFENQTSTNYCYQRAGFGGRQVVCSCDTDECNGAGSLQSSLTTIIATLFVAAFLLFKRV